MDWQLNQLGRLDTAAALMFNKLEARWFTKNEYAKSYVMCDQGGQVFTTKETTFESRLLQGGPSGRGTLFVDIKFKVPPQYKLLNTKTQLQI